MGPSTTKYAIAAQSLQSTNSKWNLAGEADALMTVPFAVFHDMYMCLV